jgi:hypothetical protein
LVKLGADTADMGVGGWAGWALAANGEGATDGNDVDGCAPPWAPFDGFAPAGF